MYDIIGDIHGYANKLEELLINLGYEKKTKYYSHAERKVIFVGDYIDRGPQIKETLSIVRNMVKEGTAFAIMGNHEYNALCYHTETSKGNYLREHNAKNLKQHEETLKQFEFDSKEFKNYMDWMRTLSVYLELEDLRVVHACWKKNNIDVLENKIVFSKEFLLYIHDEGKDLYDTIDETLKGIEHKIPNGYFFNDKDGHTRYYNRLKWWVNPEGKTYDECYFEEVKELSGKLIDEHTGEYYAESERPVFCGHYWLNGEPKTQTKNVACVDYSIAKGNILAAYRWNGEKTLSDDNFMWIV